MKRIEHTRWYIRFFQLSPIIAGALLAFVLLAVPAGLRAQLDTIREFTESARASGDTALLEQLDPVDVANRYMESRSPFLPDDDRGPTSPTAFSTLCSDVLSATAADHNELFSADGEPVSSPWPADDPRFADILRYEEATGAEVTVFFLPEPPLPSLAAKSVPRPALLPSEEDIADYYYPGDTDGGRMIPVEDVVADPWLLRWAMGDRAKHPTFDAMYGSGSGVYLESVAMEYSLQLLPSGSYVFVAYSSARVDDVPPESIITDPQLLLTDPTAPDYQTELDIIAEKHRSDIFVLGPLQTQLVPMRTPEGAGFRTGELADKLWPPSDAHQYDQPSAAIEIPPDTRAYTGDGRWMYASIIHGSMAEMNGTDPHASDVSPQTLLVVATFAEHPNALSASRLGPLGRLWRSAQVLLAVNQGALLGVTGLLLAMAIVASPAAFIVERNRITQGMLLEEMERVQQDAHDKVYNRLSALSKRVEIANSRSGDTGHALDGVAEDIRDTVSDLQEILGDARQRTATMTGRDPLRSQLESVAREQAARLGVEVSLTMSEAVPALTAQVGWDLQCVLEEAISNAVEHGGASTVIASLTADAEAVSLKVEDDGGGMNVTDLESLPEDSMGLRGMKNRAERHGGRFRATSTPLGATVEVLLPLKQARTEP